MLVAYLSSDFNFRQQSGGTSLRSFATIRNAAFAVLAFGACSASAATVTIGPYTFDTTAFPTSATFVSGGPSAFNFATTGSVNGDILKALDSDLGSYLFGTPTTFDATFGNGGIRNGAGADFVVFELGAPDNFSLTINGSTQSFLTASIGVTSPDGFAVNAAAVDLTSFGVASNAVVNTIRLNDASTAPGGTISASIAAIGALNFGPVSPGVPEPSTMLLSMGALAFTGFARRRRIV